MYHLLPGTNLQWGDLISHNSDTAQFPNMIYYVFLFTVSRSASCHGILLLKERRTKTQRGYFDTSLIKMKIEQYTKTINVKKRKQPYLV
jgi:hypothetical protein